MSTLKITEHNAETGQTFERDMTDEEVKAHEALVAEYESVVLPSAE